MIDLHKKCDQLLERTRASLCKQGCKQRDFPANDADLIDSANDADLIDSANDADLIDRRETKLTK